MRRGTTPTHTIGTSISLVGAEVIYVTYKQAGQTVVEKTIDDIEVSENEIAVTLTQEETLAFDSRIMASVQIRARFATGQAIASNIMTVGVDRILKGGVI